MASQNNYSSIKTLLNSNESAVTSLSSIHNIEAFLLDKAAAAELHQPTTNSEVLSLKSMDGVDAREQYKHLSQLLHMQQAIKYKR